MSSPDDTATQPEQEHRHWWQMTPLAFEEEQVSPTTKALRVTEFVRLCGGCGQADLVRPFIEGLPEAQAAKSDG